MRKYRAKVNGTLYEIEIEEVSGTRAAPYRPGAPERHAVLGRAGTPARPAILAAPTPAAPAAQPVTGGEHILAPMPGNILEVLVCVGQSVKKGQNLIMLEAMKMENEILAPRDGVVSNVSVQKGNSVNTGDLLCALN